MEMQFPRPGPTAVVRTHPFFWDTFHTFARSSWTWYVVSEPPPAMTCDVLSKPYPEGGVAPAGDAATNGLASMAKPAAATAAFQSRFTVEPPFVIRCFLGVCCWWCSGCEGLGNLDSGRNPPGSTLVENEEDRRARDHDGGEDDGQQGEVARGRAAALVGGAAGRLVGSRRVGAVRRLGGRPVRRVGVGGLLPARRRLGVDGLAPARLGTGRQDHPDEHLVVGRAGVARRDPQL